MLNGWRTPERGKRIRLRFSNVFGVQPLTIDNIFVGVQLKAGAILPGSNRAVTFNGGKSMTILQRAMSG